MKLVRKTFDGTTVEATSHLTKAASCQVIGYRHSTTRANNARQVAGYDRAPVGAGHAREKMFAGMAAPTTTAFIPVRGIAARAARGMMRTLFKRVFDIQGVQ